MHARAAWGTVARDIAMSVAVESEGYGRRAFDWVRLGLGAIEHFVGRFAYRATRGLGRDGPRETETGHTAARPPFDRH